MFRHRDSNLNLHLPLLGRGTTQYLPHFIFGIYGPLGYIYGWLKKPIRVNLLDAGQYPPEVQLLAPEKWPSQKESNLPIIHLSGAMLNFRGVYLSFKEGCFHQPGFPWNNGIPIAIRYLLGGPKGRVFGRYNLTRLNALNPKLAPSNISPSNHLPKDAADFH